MRALADENYPAPSVQILREAGHDVVAVAETNPGLTNGDVAETAAGQGRILLTLDKDFGQIAFRERKVSLIGIVLVRGEGLRPDEPGQLLLEAMQAGVDLEGQFVVLRRGQVRATLLPQPQ
jgi:predicted nuclease of predicted toxin-antitoxin system